MSEGSPVVHTPRRSIRLRNNLSTAVLTSVPAGRVSLLPVASISPVTPQDNLMEFDWVYLTSSFTTFQIRLFSYIFGHKKKLLPSHMPFFKTICTSAFSLRVLLKLSKRSVSLRFFLLIFGVKNHERTIQNYTLCAHVINKKKNFFFPTHYALERDDREVC